MILRTLVAMLKTMGRLASLKPALVSSNHIQAQYVGPLSTRSTAAQQGKKEAISSSCNKSNTTMRGHRHNKAEDLLVFGVYLYHSISMSI